MAEKEMKKLNDASIEQVSGGGLFTGFSTEEYEAAGVSVKNPNFFTNEGYTLKYSGETLTEAEADYAVFFFKNNGRPGISRYEITSWAKEHFKHLS